MRGGSEGSGVTRGDEEVVEALGGGDDGVEGVLALESGVARLEVLNSFRDA